jgi:hypothetical protein
MIYLSVLRSTCVVVAQVALVAGVVHVAGNALGAWMVDQRRTAIAREHDARVAREHAVTRTPPRA